jgi:hypothetical protein
MIISLKEFKLKNIVNFLIYSLLTKLGLAINDKYGTIKPIPITSKIETKIKNAHKSISFFLLSLIKYKISLI